MPTDPTTPATSGPVVPEVTLLLTPRAWGGHEVALFGWLGDAARDEGLAVQVFAPGDELRAACEQARLPCIAPPGRAGRVGQWLGLLHALRRCPPQQPLLLAPGHLHAAAWLLALAVLLRRRVWLYVPITHSARWLGYRWGALRDRALAPWLRRAEALITVDDVQAERLRQLWRVRAPVHCLPNTVRLPEPSASLRSAGPWGEALRIAFVGRFEPHQKGLDWLAALLRRGAAWTRHYRWRFQGRGPAELELLELASALGPQLVEVCPHAPLDEALAACDLLLLPSRYEGVPLVALEATERGWPVVASRQAGVDAMLPPSSLFEFGDEDGLRGALASLRAPAARAAAVDHARARREALWPAARHAAARRAIVGAWRAPAARLRGMQP